LFDWKFPERLRRQNRLHFPQQLAAIAPEEQSHVRFSPGLESQG
jgi:hypothetical protein